MNIQPYQEESNRLRKAEALPGELIKGTAGLVASGSLANRILPLINQYVPENIMQKGLSKINPKLGSFVEQAQNMGFGADEVRDFLQKKLGEKKEKEEPKKQANPLQEFETNYPEIAQALANTMKQGQSPDAAAGILKMSSLFGKKVKELEKSVGKNFIDYVLELFGPQGGSMQQPQQMNNEEPVAMTQEMYDQHQADYNRQQGQQQGQQQAGPQGGNIDQEIMAALDKILKM